MRIWLANPRGFCAGVERAIAIVERALAEHGAPVYVRHAIVHSETVVAALERNGAVFVQDVDEIPTGAPAVFSAHGVPTRVRVRARERGLDVIDATCPLVERVHREARRHARDGCSVLVVGHAGHPEVVGTAGQVTGAQVVSTLADVEGVRVNDPSRVAYVTQTTLGVDDAQRIVDALVARFPAIRGGATRDVCYATRNRQAAVRALAAACDRVLVIGSAASSNVARLYETAVHAGCAALQLAGPEDLRRDAFDGVGTLGIASGASTPECLVEGTVRRLNEWFDCEVRDWPGPRERVVLPLPRRHAVAGRPGAGA